MVLKKRSYVPKVKGCYQCSQRRINCDGTKPICTKCTSKGLTCSGFGLRFRFLDEASISQKRRPEFYPPKKTSLADETYFEALDASSVPSESTIRPSTKPSTLSQDDASVSQAIDVADGYDGSIMQTPSAFLEPILWDMQAVEEPHVTSTVQTPGVKLTQESVFPDTSAAVTKSPNWEDAFKLSIVCSDVNALEPHKEFLLSYFSDNIAPEMVVVDGCYNGWRHIVLPVAWYDDMIMDAVMAASAFHLAGKISTIPPTAPHQLYARAIRQLAKRRDLEYWDTETRHLVILAIVVFLVAAMVNGMSDFPIVYQMLQSALGAVGGEEDLEGGGSIGSFLVRQVRKMRAYAAPLLSQEAGVYTITHHAKQSSECLEYYRDLYPDFSGSLDLIASLRKLAFSMYLNRVTALATEGNGALQAEGPADDLMEVFQSSLLWFPPGSFGEHVLVWPAFIAALECCTDESRDFFRGFLRRQYERSGFNNVLRALDLLETIWSQGQAVATWPALLPGMRVFVM